MSHIGEPLWVWPHQKLLLPSASQGWLETSLSVMGRMRALLLYGAGTVQADYSKTITSLLQMSKEGGLVRHSLMLLGEPKVLFHSIRFVSHIEKILTTDC